MLKYRVLTGGGFLSLVAALYVWGVTPLIGVVLLGVTALAVTEMVQMMTTAGYPALKWTSLAVVLLWMLGVYAQGCGCAVTESIPLLIAVLGVWAVSFGCLFRSDQTKSLAKVAGSFLTIFYVGGLMQFMFMLLQSGQGDQDGRSLLLYAILVIKFTDMGAYFVGSAIGKHKMIPAISPAKTWEGVIGGVAVATAVSSLLMYLYNYEVSGIAFSRVDGLILGVGLAVMGVVGDLVESMLKRAAGVKDSGTWLKGMGGILDVLDSLIFALPLLYIYLRWGLNGL
ncbi:CDP-archaeol synthase [Kiritimatiellaeota bacterium B1221]|nr:CDP-archaeol synthase [Kiritimatiellaeota bacterium B1221]